MSARSNQPAPDPRQAPPVATATRRDLFGTLGAMLLLTAAEAGPAKAAERDGELLAACAKFDQLEHAYVGLCHCLDRGSLEAAAAEAEQKQISEAQELLVSRICEFRATSHKGQLARVSSLILWEGGDCSGDLDSPYINSRLLGAILRDLVDGSAGA